MNKIVLIGGGGHCKSVLDAILRAGIYSKIVITDPVLTAGEKILNCEVVGDDSVLPDLYQDGFINAFISVGSITDVKIRKRLVELADRIGFFLPNIIDPSATVSEHAKLGRGVFVGKQSVINADVVIGSHCIINTGCIIEHECQIDEFTHVSVGSILCGNCVVGAESFVGAGSTVIQGVKIGKKTIIGAGSLVLNDIAENMQVHGIVKH